MSHNITVQGGTTVRLPTAGKYCDQDIIVTAEGGSIDLNVVTAASLPSTVVDGQIVVITDTAAGTVYIDTDEPGSHAVGDVWIEVAAGGDAALELTEESPILRNGLVFAYQWTGAAWDSYDGYLGVAGEWAQFSSQLPPVGTPLNDMSWADIAKIQAADKSAKYFSIGDKKTITINGTLGSTAYGNVSVDAFIIGINHNEAWEGKGLHFQIGKIDNKIVALIDSKYGSTSSSANNFVMKNTNNNTDGWAGAHIRTYVLGTSTTPEEPRSTSLLAALPAELRAVMKGVPKYTDNKGNKTNTADCVTATTEYLWLLSEYEVFGVQGHANVYEQNYQEQYEYYAAGNPPAASKYNNTSQLANAWLRSPTLGLATHYVIVAASGAASYAQANSSQGICPCFCV